MKILTEILLDALILGFLQFQHAAGTPMNLKEYQVFVQMGDFSDFEGNIRRSTFFQGAYHMPLWMHPGEAEYVSDVSAFILTNEGEHYEAALNTTNGPEDHDPYPSTPVICEIRLAGQRHFSTAIFEEYKPVPSHHPGYVRQPFRNSIYIALRGNHIYRAVLLAPHEIARSHPNSPSSPHSAHPPPRAEY